MPARLFSFWPRSRMLSKDNQCGCDPRSVLVPSERMNEVKSGHENI
jgi:hypothetical protein